MKLNKGILALLIVFITLSGWYLVSKTSLLQMFRAKPTAEELAEASKLHAEGLKFFNQGKYDEAMELWLEEARLDPYNANTHNNIGIACRYMQDYDTAIKYHKKAISLDPTFGKPYHGLGVVCMDQKGRKQGVLFRALRNFGIADVVDKEYPEKAKNYFLKAMEHNYRHPDVYFMLGGAYSALHDYEQAAASFRKTIELKPNFPMTHYLLGEAYMQLRQFDAARAAFQNEISARSQWSIFARIANARIDAINNPNDPKAWFILAKENKAYVAQTSTLSGFEQYLEALQSFKKVISLDPAYSGVHYQLGELHTIPQEDYYMAKYEFTQELKYHPGDKKARAALNRVNRKLKKLGLPETSERVKKLTERGDIEDLEEIERIRRDVEKLKRQMGEGK